LESLIGALLLSSQILGVGVSSASRTADLIQAIMGKPSVDASLPPEVKDLQELALHGSSNSASREDIQRRVLRMASFAQGEGDPSALDAVRIAAAAMRVLYPPPRLESLPTEIQRYLAIMTQKLSDLDSLLTAAQEALPTAWEIDPGDFRSTIAAIDVLLEKAATANRLPAGIDRTQIRHDGGDLTEEDWTTVQQVRHDLANADELGPTEKIALLVGGWHASAARVVKWSEPAFEALNRLEASLTSPNSPSQHLDEVREVFGDLLSSAQSAAERLVALAESER
jgi:hypothetical protein